MALVSIYFVHNKLMSLFSDLQRRYPNRPVIEFETAAQEQMKITELRLAKLFSANSSTAAAIGDQPASVAMKAHGNMFSEMLLLLDLVTCKKLVYLPTWLNSFPDVVMQLLPL